MYLYVKAIHVVAVVTLISGMLAMALALRVAITGPLERNDRRLLEAILRWDGLVTTPALAVVWMAGFTMAFGAGWDTSPWLLLKMIPAISLSGLHSIQGRALRRLLRDRLSANRLFRFAPVAIFSALVAAVWLVVVKPF